MSSHKSRTDVPDDDQSRHGLLRSYKRYWGRHFWGRGFFSTTSGNVTDELINAYIDGHTDGKRSENETNISLE